MVLIAPSSPCIGKERQKGSAIFFLFAAIAFLGLLSYAFLQGTRGNLSMIKGEADKAASYQAQDCNNAIAMAKERLTVRGCGSMVSYMSDGSNEHAGAPVDGSCSIFHPNGGGIKVCDISIATGPDPCKAATAPAFGTVCNDGTLYMGLSPDGGARYAAAAADEAGTYRWGPNFTSTFVTNTNTGEANTNALVGLDAVQYVAASVCFNKVAHGHDDWYLPAWNELAPMYNAGNYMVGIDPSSYYGSSSEHTMSNNLVRAMSMASGLMAARAKNVPIKVRCVRKL